MARTGTGLYEEGMRIRRDHFLMPILLHLRKFMPAPLLLIVIFLIKYSIEQVGIRIKQRAELKALMKTAKMLPPPLTQEILKVLEELEPATFPDIITHTAIQNPVIIVSNTGSVYTMCFESLLEYRSCSRFHPSLGDPLNVYAKVLAIISNKNIYGLMSAIGESGVSLSQLDRKVLTQFMCCPVTGDPMVKAYVSSDGTSSPCNAGDSSCNADPSYRNHLLERLIEAYRSNSPAWATVVYDTGTDSARVKITPALERSTI